MVGKYQSFDFYWQLGHSLDFVFVYLHLMRKPSRCVLEDQYKKDSSVRDISDFKILMVFIY